MILSLLLAKNKFCYSFALFLRIFYQMHYQRKTKPALALAISSGVSIAVANKQIERPILAADKNDKISKLYSTKTKSNTTIFLSNVLLMIFFHKFSQ